MKKILVTGGAGFIGSNLIKSLIKYYNDCLIISLDNYQSGSIENHLIDSKIIYLNGNTYDILKIKEINEFDADLVFHFGEFSRIFLSFEKVNDTFFSNTIGTQQVLEYCVEKKAKLIYSGSSAIFGNNLEDQHLNPYCWTKAKNIELIKNYGNWFGLKYVISYFYNVYGENQISSGPYSTVIGIFERQFKLQQPLTVVYPGTQTRCFTSIHDIIDGLLLIAENGEGDNFFIGTTDNVSILDIAKMFDTPYEFIPERKGERMFSLIKDSEIHKLGWKPRLNVREYIMDVRKKCKPSLQTLNLNLKQG
jgi:UDP-glucose 4-epimerase